MKNRTLMKKVRALFRSTSRTAGETEIGGPGGRSIKRTYGYPGQSLIIIAVAFFAILGFVGFAVDTGIIYLYRTWLGQAVDAASLASGVELPNLKAACNRAVEYLRTNDYVAGSDFSFQIVFPSEPNAPGGDPGEFVIDSVADSILAPDDCASITIPAKHQSVHYHVSVSGTQTVPAIFMRILGFDTINVGAPGTAERSAKYDIVLVLDKSGSMKWDSCGWYRPADQYACTNHYGSCTTFYNDDFESYDDDDEEELEEDGDWTLEDDDRISLISPGHSSGQAVQLMGEGKGDDAKMYLTLSTVGQQDVAVYFWARNQDLNKKEFLQIEWREGGGWNRIMQIKGSNLPSSWTQYAILLPSAADDSPNIEIQFRTKNNKDNEHGFDLDDVEIKSCPIKEGPWLWFKDGGSKDCPDGPMNCDTEAPETLLPGNSIGPDKEPMAQLMEQPMFDVLLASSKFIEIVDSRRLPMQPREDQIGLAVFANGADKLHDLTTDYEAIQTTLFTDVNADGWTNIGDGMRVGLSILGNGGRPNTTHFMILLTDGWPNRYDTPYINPTLFERKCSSGPCVETLSYIDAQTGEARNQNVTIFAIGLGENLDTLTFDANPPYGPGTDSFTGMDLLRRIAEGTGGQAYLAPTSEELEKIFEWIAEAIFVRLTG